jgi:hypothetical protein
MGFVFKGYDDETGIPRFDYTPDVKSSGSEPASSKPEKPEGITKPSLPSPSASPPMKTVEDTSPPCNQLLFFLAGCAVGAVVILVLKD